MIAWSLFYLTRHLGIDEYKYIEIVSSPNRLLHINIHLALGLVTGILYATLELVFERPAFQKMPYGRLIILKSVIYLIMTYILLVFTVINFHFNLYGEINWILLKKWCTSFTFLIGLIYFLMVSTFISIFRQINYKCGPGILWNMLKGKYHQPREEERIFMFLDLRSSTTIAEQLGHIRFSRFIQDCFFDLTEVVLSNQVEIYQYVGDEVILSWPIEEGIKNNHCLALYFDYANKLNTKKEYYKQNYGVHPYFKAGSHIGKVTVAEVGVIKKEIAYLGDVLNTAARIQGRCNELNHGFLVSEELVNQINIGSQYNAKKLGVQSLRGKQQEVTIYGIEQLN